MGAGCQGQGIPSQGSFLFLARHCLSSVLPSSQIPPLTGNQIIKNRSPRGHFIFKLGQTDSLQFHQRPRNVVYGILKPRIIILHLWSSCVWLSFILKYFFLFVLWTRHSPWSSPGVLWRFLHFASLEFLRSMSRLSACERNTHNVLWSFLCFWDYWWNSNGWLERVEPGFPRRAAVFTLEFTGIL